MSTTIKYSREYSQLGKVRGQQGIPEHLPKDVKKIKSKDRKPGDKLEVSQFDFFWSLRRDLGKRKNMI